MTSDQESSSAIETLRAQLEGEQLVHVRERDRLRSRLQMLLLLLRDYRATPDHQFCLPEGVVSGRNVHDTRCEICRRTYRVIDAGGSQPGQGCPALDKESR